MMGRGERPAPPPEEQHHTPEVPLEFGVEFGIRPGDVHHGPMIALTSHTDLETTAANITADEAMRAAGLNPFHQVGHGDKPGRHGWEALFVHRDGLDNELTGLVPGIQQAARDWWQQWQ